MIGFFTDPYPDELLYSACARYSDRTRYPNANLTVKRLFGSPGATAIVDLPSRINHLLSVLPLNHNYTADRLIDQHTLAPFYAPFLPIKRVHLLRQEMKEDRSFYRIRGHIGTTNSSIKSPAWLRFCPMCEREDKAKFPARYWHRVHQISGIELCPTHAVFLEDSCAPWHNPKIPSKFISAEKAIHTAEPRHADPSIFNHTIQLKLALDAEWLLNWHGHTSDLIFLRERYYNLLLRRGLAYYNGKIKMSDLSEELVRFYSPEFLEKLQCEINNYYKGWVFGLVHTTTLAVVQPPIRHLLLMTFLGHTAKEFFTSSDIFKPFGDKPWPCLNHASNHFGQLIIDECRVSDSLVKKQRGKPVGTFSCKCGFVYNRVGPDSSEEDRRRINSVESYGPIWEKTLREVWVDTSISLREAAGRLGVSELTVVRYAIRLELPMNFPGTRSVGPKTLERYKSFRRSREEALEFYRQEWLSLLKANPDASRRQLATISSFLYMWLKKTDSKWLEAHLPLVRKTNRQGDLKDWNKIDIELAPAVEATAKRIREAPGRPTRISLAAIMREVGHKSWLEFSLHKLPLTSKILEDYLESVEDFLIRRVRWAEDWYSKSGTYPSRHYFEVHAGTRHKAGKAPTVQSAIDGALQRLNKKFK